jgi:hypothetical protein
MTNNLMKSVLSHPNPLRELTKRLVRKFNLGNYEQRLSLGAVERPQYGYCVYHAAILARKLGYRSMSVLEFGVAGGSGLLNLEYHATEVQKILPIKIEIYGFDTGEGLPKPLDYRDLPYIHKKGLFKMNAQELKKRLKMAKLVLGDIRETGDSFFQKYNPSPIGGIMYDLDYYSSTASALKMLEANEKYYLPRVFCYFDDVIGREIEMYSDYIGERLAINEFNQTHKTKKLAKPYYLLAREIAEFWYHKIWIFHNFEHSRYNDFIGEHSELL